MPKGNYARSTKSKKFRVLIRHHNPANTHTHTLGCRLTKLRSFHIPSFPNHCLQLSPWALLSPPLPLPLSIGFLLHQWLSTLPDMKPLSFLGSLTSVSFCPGLPRKPQVNSFLSNTGVSLPRGEQKRWGAGKRRQSLLMRYLFLLP